MEDSISKHEDYLTTIMILISHRLFKLQFFFKLQVSIHSIDKEKKFTFNFS